MFRSRFTRALVLPLATLVMATSLAACGCDGPDAPCPIPTPTGSPTPTPTSLAIVIQAAANSTKPYLPDEVADEVRDVVEHDGKVSVVNADGTPDFVLSDVHLEGDLSTDGKADQAILLRNSVVDSVLAAQPDSNGIDMVGALIEAARASSGERPEIAVVGSGLSDTGTYDVTKEGMSLSPPDSLVAQLTDKDLASLKGVSVRWWWLGQGVGAQHPLAPAQVSNITAFYQAYVARAGGHLTLEKGVPDTSIGPVQTTYAVRTLSPATTVIVPQAEGNGTDVFNGTSQLSFGFDSTQFTQPSLADKTAGEYVAWLKAHPTGRLHIVGTTASAGDPAHLVDLSSRRAEALRALILGKDTTLDPARITVEGRGVGPAQPDHEGQPNEDTAKVMANRAVTVQRIVS